MNQKALLNQTGKKWGRNKLTTKWLTASVMRIVPALALIATPAFASVPEAIFIPAAGNIWSGTWKKVSWYPQFWNRKPGEADYIRGTRRGGNIATIEILRRREHCDKQGYFDYGIHIAKYDCANDTNDLVVEVVASPQKLNPSGEVFWNGRINPWAKPITIYGIKYWWNPKPSSDNQTFKMKPPFIGTYGAAVQDAVCSNVR